MKAIAIVGFKNSGKSSLVVGLAGILKKKGYTVGIVKHSHGKISIADKDKPFSKYAKEIFIVSDKEVSGFSKKMFCLEDVLSNLNVDFVLVEGFKLNKSLPRIVCFKTEKEKEELSCGLEIAFVAKKEFDNKQYMERLARLVEMKAFKLPNTNCGKCGFSSCFDLAKQILKGKRNISDCLALKNQSRVWIDDRLISINPFVSDILKGILRGFLTSLKGVNKIGRIKIEIDKD
jgi:molybdopterin-guanine dinucleotide biosynthesis protein B